MTTNWFPHSKAFGKRAEIARILAEETPLEQAWALPDLQLQSFGESVVKGEKRPAPDASSSGVAPEKRTVTVKRPAPNASSSIGAPEKRTVTVKRPTKSVASSNTLVVDQSVKANDVVDITSLKVAELKQELSARGLPKSGNKSVLVSRLEAYLAEDHQNPHKRKK